MACGCKKNAAAKSASVVKTTTPSQESTPQKKIGNRIIKREIR